MSLFRNLGGNRFTRVPHGFLSMTTTRPPKIFFSDNPLACDCGVKDILVNEEKLRAVEGAVCQKKHRGTPIRKLKANNFEDCEDTGRAKMHFVEYGEIWQM
jgi:hypothetical protein